MTTRALHLHEEALLLALADEKGTPEFGAWYTQAIGGAVLAELLLGGRIRLDGDGAQAMVEVVDRTPMGDPVIDECLGILADSKKQRNASGWVSKLADVRDLKDKVASELCRERVLRVDEKRVLGIFSRTIYPELDPVPERRLRERIERAVRSESRDLDPRTAVLIAVAHHTGLLSTIFSKRELRERKERIREVSSGEVVGQAAAAAAEATQAVQTAILVACVMPAIIH